MSLLTRLQVIAASQRGAKASRCEKPLGISADEGRAAIDAVKIWLPAASEVTEDHLLVGRQWEQVQASRENIHPADYPHGVRSAHTTLNELLADPTALAVLRAHAPQLVDVT